MPRYSPAPLLTNPRPSTPPTPHRTHSHQDGGNSPATSLFGGGNVTHGGIFSNPMQGQQQQQQQQHQLSSHTPGGSGIAWGGSATGNLFQQSHASLSSPSSSQHVQWGSTPSALPASIQWGSTSSFSAGPSTAHASTPSSSTHHGDPFSSATPQHNLSPYSLPDKTRKSESKRKRMQEEDEDEEMGGPNAALQSSPERGGGGEGGIRPMVGGQGRNLVPKRIRAGLGGVLGLDEGIGVASGSNLAANANIGGSKVKDDEQKTPNSNVDLGKMLASLDKPNLLSLLSSLLSQHPEIVSSIHTLLPLPTLESVNQSLNAYEAAIKSALPFNAQNVSIRSEYTWNRLRGPVGELVSGVQGWMNFFHAKEEQENENGGVHPSTMFSLLHTITARTIKIQKDLLPTVPDQWISGSSSLHSSAARDRSAVSSGRSSSQQVLFSALPSGSLSPANPNALLTTLLPLLLGAWDGLLARIANDINGKGKMFGREVVVAWLRGVEGLAGGDIAASGSGESEEDGQRLEVLRSVQKSLKGVEADFKREIGWVVGLF